MATRLKLSQEHISTVKRHVAAYACPDTGLAYQMLGTTLAIHAALLLMWPVVYSNWHPTLIAAWTIAYAMNHVRCFVIGHDCAHHTAFVSAAENQYVGVVLGGLASMPFLAWRRRHLQHHAHLGIEEDYESDHSRTIFWTQQQWDSWPLWRKAVMRVLREPFIFFTLGAAIIVMVLGGGLPGKAHSGTRMPARRALWLHIKAAALMIAVQVTQAVLLLAVFPSRSCWLAWLAVYVLLAAPLASAIGMSLFHLQHHVNVPYRAPRQDHTRELAALLGSTYLIVPWWAKWATLGIEYHHIHHFCATVPCYKLQACHEDAPAGLWRGINTVAPSLALRSMFNIMWDEAKQLYVSFPEYEALFSWLQQLVKNMNV